jgi:DNA polymerase-3 subunit gamma/tau
MDAPAEKIAPVLAVDSFEGLIALAVQKRDLSVKAALERDVRLVRCEDGRLDVALEPSASKTLVNNLSDKFTQWTGRRWVVVVSREAAQPTVKSVLEAKQAELKTGVQADPLVQAVMARFPGATIVDVRAADQTAALPPGDPEEMLPEEPPPADEDSYGADWMRDEDRED